MSDFTVIGERRLADAGFMSFDELTVAAPDGETFTRAIVRHCGAVAVVPLLDDNTVVCVRQFRVALGHDLLEIVAGRQDIPGEPPEVAAQRELAEEIGMRAGRLVPLTDFYSGPGFTDELLRVFLALDLEPDGSADRDGHEEQYMRIEHVPLANVPELIATGALTDAKSIIGMLLTQAYLDGAYEGARG